MIEGGGWSEEGDDFDWTEPPPRSRRRETGERESVVPESAERAALERELGLSVGSEVDPSDLGVSRRDAGEGGEFGTALRERPSDTGEYRRPGGRRPPPAEHRR